MYDDFLDEKDVLFIMQIGNEMQNFLLSKLAKQPDNKKAHLFHVFLTNFVCNTLDHLSSPENLDTNITNFIKTVEMWRAKKNTSHCELKNVHYNRLTNSVKIEDLPNDK